MNWAKIISIGAIWSVVGLLAVFVKSPVVLGVSTVVARIAAVALTEIFG